MILIILDRDGTIINNDDFLGKNDNWKKKIKLNMDLVKLLKEIDSKHKSIKLVISNQSGVAMGLFDEKRVVEINSFLDETLRKHGILIKQWNFCPYVDKTHTEKTPKTFIKKYIKKNSGRKPSKKMIIESLNKIGKNLHDFDRILVFGDREEDRLLAENIGAKFVDVKARKYSELKNYIKESIDI